MISDLHICHELAYAAFMINLTISSKSEQPFMFYMNSVRLS